MVLTIDNNCQSQRFHNILSVINKRKKQCALQRSLWNYGWLHSEAYGVQWVKLVIYLKQIGNDLRNNAFLIIVVLMSIDSLFNESNK